MGYFSRPNIKDFMPAIPKKYSFAPAELRDFLFTKAFNGYAQALRCPPMNRLFEVPRSAYLMELYKKYPRESIKDSKNRRREDKARRKKLRELAESLPTRTMVTIEGPFSLSRLITA